MAVGKYARIDGHNSSNYCLRLSIAVFIVTCLIATWMAMSSSIDPLRAGITLQQFMGGMPKKASASNSDSHKDTLKVNASQGIVQDDSRPDKKANETVTPNEPRSSEAVEKHESELRGEKGVQADNTVNTPNVAESFVYGDGGDYNKSQNIYSGQDRTYTSDQEAAMDKSTNGTIESHDGDGKPSAQDSADVRDKTGETETRAEETKGYQQKSPSDKEELDAMKIQDGPPNQTEKAGPEESKGSKGYFSDMPLGPVSSDWKHVSNETSPQGGSKESKSADERETETKGYQQKTPSDKEEMDAVKILDGTPNQIEKAGQDESKGSKAYFSDIPLAPVSKDLKDVSNETSSKGVPRPTQSDESAKEKMSEGNSSSVHESDHKWKVCNVTAGSDYIPCLDNIQAIKNLRTTIHYEHRERHCPEEAPTCLVTLPKGYKTPIKWPNSRDMIWFANVPHTRLAEYKGGQNWVKVYDRYLTFPGGGTQFKYGALHYIDYLQKSVPDIAWGKRSRVVLDVGCGVASFGGYLFDRDVLTMSLAPKDEHEAQVQFALERGIPAISAVMGTKRLPFPSNVFDIVHCARCRVPWHIEGGKLLLELNRILRPGGYFVWSATPVYRKDAENAGIWKDMSKLIKSICWELVIVERDVVNRKAAAIFRKPASNQCYEQREKNDPPLCEESDDPDEALYTPLKSCIHKVATGPSERGFQWPPSWPTRLEKPPDWLKDSETFSKNFTDDYNYWKQILSTTYLNTGGIDWSSVRNVMDMRASYGGFAAALKDMEVWVMNVVPVNSSDTLPVIYERGLFGIYHDWCESFSTYPRTYDLLHADRLFSDLKKRCNFVAVMAEVDRILRPGGWLIVRDDAQTVSEVESIAVSLHWKIQFTRSKDNTQIICLQKTKWRPSEVETVPSAVGHAGHRA